MVEETIMLYSIDDVKKLASIANTKKYDIDISLGKYLVNAKSIMGIFSLDLTRRMELQIDDVKNDFGEFFMKIKKLGVICLD